MPRKAFLLFLVAGALSAQDMPVYELDEYTVVAQTKSPSSEDVAEAYLYGGSFDYLAGGLSGGWQLSGGDLQCRTWNADNMIGMLKNDMLPDVRTDQLGVWAVQERINMGTTF